MGRSRARAVRRTATVCLALAVALVAVAAYTLATGDYPLPLEEVLRILGGAGRRAQRYVVTQVRLPRVLTATLVGLALGAAGALFQSLARNPLGSPDVIGFTVGSATGALVAILVIGAGPAAVAGGSVAGGALTAAVVYLLAWNGGVRGYRLVLVGIGVSALLASFNAYLLAKASFGDAQSAAVWLTGSLNGRGWEHVRPLLVVLVVSLPVATGLGRPLRALELGEDVATGLGVPLERVRACVMVTGVVLTASATAAAGPVAFVALAAPQVARRLTRSAGPGVTASALTGAVMLTVSDLAAQRLLAPTQLPVGVLTGVAGGCYLIWLLARQWRTERTGR
ncbi:iron chelate uptake ABC transporter family permease subunit [Streptosporangium sp. NPDC051023]|uniref:FecCD family ABC transporter permease n=1 Tax=Streptosporangium sp. NPDC051023 TaxID=3155410 RepID=UPI00344D4C1F